MSSVEDVTGGLERRDAAAERAEWQEEAAASLVGEEVEQAAEDGDVEPEPVPSAAGFAQAPLVSELLLSGARFLMDLVVRSLRRQSRRPSRVRRAERPKATR